MGEERKFMALVAVEHDLLREKIAGILSRDESIWSTAQVSDLQGAKRVCESAMPDIVVYDVSDGLVNADSVREIKSRGGAMVIAFSEDDGDVYKEAARRAGADEFAVAHSLFDSIKRAIASLYMRCEETSAASA